MDFIDQLSKTIDQRLAQPQPGSYVSELHQRGLNRMVQKCGEEACELVIAAKDYAIAPDDPELRAAVLSESADLLFHHLILLRKLGISLADVVAELEARARPS